jgi:hypothetical protein
VKWVAILVLGAGLLLAASSVQEAPLFSNITARAGIIWEHFSGESNDRWLLETMGGGVGFLDFDGDGQLDIFLVTGGETPNHHSPSPPACALYRNHNGHFEDVAAKAGVARLPFYGMGVAVADYDNDGRPDLFVTGYPRSALYHNNGDGTFSDVTERAGVMNAGKWATGAAWIDYDRDGRLDLFVSNYVKFSYSDHKHCAYRDQNTYCAQTAYEGDVPTLFHNNGDGTFTDVTAAAGLAQMAGRALGVIAIDIDDDGWTDLVVARDADPTLLLLNQHNGTFRDVAFDADIAYNADGVARAGMGIDAADLMGTGRPDLVLTAFNDETHALYRNTGGAAYKEITLESNLGAFTKKMVGWGVHFLDYDNDGNQDLVIVNGHLNPAIEDTRNDVSYREPPLLLHNEGSAVFRVANDAAGPAFKKMYLARGLAVGDFDNDGQPDILFSTLDGSPVLLHNNGLGKNTWIGLTLRGTVSNRDAIGAKVSVEAGTKVLTQWVVSGSSYMSSSDKRLLFGLGKWPPATPVNAIIRWPNGKVQKLTALTPCRYHDVIEAIQP